MNIAAGASFDTANARRDSIAIRILGRKNTVAIPTGKEGQDDGGQGSGKAPSADQPSERSWLTLFFQLLKQALTALGEEARRRIILRSMARMPGDRFRDMGEMLAALERYLDGSGLGGVKDELARFFKAPAPYEMALKARLVDHLLRRARDCLTAGNQPVALEQLDRVLAIDPVNPHVTEILGRLKSMDYSGWLVVEQDIMPGPYDPDAAQAAQVANRAMLRANGY